MVVGFQQQNINMTLAGKLQIYRYDVINNITNVIAK